MGAILVGWGLLSCVRGWQQVLSFFLSIAKPSPDPRGTVSDGSGSEFRTFVRRMAQQAHGKMFEVDLPLYLCDWGTMACRLPVPASHWAAASDDEKHPPRPFSRAFSCTLGERAGSEEHFLKNSKQTSRVCFVLQSLIWPGRIHCELWKASVGLDLEKVDLEKGWGWIGTGPWGTFQTEQHVTAWAEESGCS